MADDDRTAGLVLAAGVGSRSDTPGVTVDGRLTPAVRDGGRGVGAPLRPGPCPRAHEHVAVDRGDHATGHDLDVPDTSWTGADLMEGSGS